MCRVTDSRIRFKIQKKLLSDAKIFPREYPRGSTAALDIEYFSSGRSVERGIGYRMSNGIDKCGERARREVSGYRSDRRKVAASTINLIAKSRRQDVAPNAARLFRRGAATRQRMHRAALRRCIRRNLAMRGGAILPGVARTLRNPASCEPPRAVGPGDADPRGRRIVAKNPAPAPLSARAI